MKINGFMYSKWQIFMFHLFNTQALSNTVSHALTLDGDPAIQETSKFCRVFNKFFDCLNVRSTKEYVMKRKPDVMPYQDKDDPRLQVCITVICK